MTPEMKSLFRAVVKRNEKLSPESSLVVFRRPEGFADASPGQFVSVRVNDSTVPLLRRPYSIMDLTRDELVLLVKIVGEGSAILASAGEGREMDLAGPLGGTSFYHPEGDDAVFIGGGTGLAPMIYAARSWARAGILGDSYLLHGAATGAELLGDFCDSDFTGVHRSTIDGSAGFRGDIVTLLVSLLEEGAIPVSNLYSCGPRGMVRAIEEKTGGRFKRHLTSLEAVMGCGIGACRGCTVPFRGEKGIVLKAVCDQGTVFDASEIAWHEWE